MHTMRTSPVHELLPRSNAVWQSIHAMPTLLSTPYDAERSARLGVIDLSCLARMGVKGRQAATWLDSQSIPVPAAPNTWCPLPLGGLVARLGSSEFLIEDSREDSRETTVARQLLAALATTLPSQVYPVLRQDLAIALCGAAVLDLLRQTCNVNFSALPLDERPLVITTMIGVAVTIRPGLRSGMPVYRLWCDSTYGAYLWRTIVEIAEELGGGVVGLGVLSAINF